MTDEDKRLIADWVSEVKREMSYPHWPDNVKKGMELPVKWLHKTLGLPVPFDFL